mmetsp:Transcript_49975/g.140034  ORF Transcript_49975/g.140034 Transcript_49975/m.140034 type:complete len:467 (-) Transcript_49975:196-1596(-)|eukprot:CAMPEP_0117496546 /NCGR_PEP_ID=MMETSP0784-20121206/20713_1 /TAXON_ID=39447 /ORGANISM="" /LENGTH=466 /DNA_ID=CAMNT_0005291521 /DNA_START=93 /DNA_END=1493 /DNA_ORIENTATION=+
MALVSCVSRAFRGCSAKGRTSFVAKGPWNLTSKFARSRSGLGRVEPASASGQPLSMRVRLALERHGDWTITVANVFQLSGFACTDALMLQSLLIIGNGGMALFFLTRMPPLKVPFAWALLKTMVNVYMVYKLTKDRKPIHLESEELDVYEEHFMPFGVTAKQFKHFWDLGTTRELIEPQNVTVEGEKIGSVSLVLSGYVYRTVGGQHLGCLDSYPGARCGNAEADGDAGAWIGEMAALRMIDNMPQTGTVSRDLERRRMLRTLSGLDHDDPFDSSFVAKEVVQARLEEQFSLALDETHSVQSRPAPEQADKVKQIDRSFWTVHADKGAVIRSWELGPLVSLCRKNAELRGMLRKAFSQSAIKKTLVMSSLSTRSSSKALVRVASANVLHDYERALVAALGDGRASPEDKLALSRFRRKHGISDCQHATILKAAVGWTPEEYEYGAPIAQIDPERSNAAQALQAVPS